MKSIPTKSYYLFIAVIIILNLQCFYLLNISITNAIVVPLEIIFFIFTFVTVKKEGKGKYNIEILFLLFIMLSSAYMASRTYGQSIVLGILGQRFWIFSMLMYFPISRLYRASIVSIDGIFKVIDRINFIYIILIFTQFILGTNHQFFQIMSNERNGSIRLYINMSFLVLSFFWHLYKLLNNKNYKLDDLFFIFSTIAIYFLVIKSRMGLFSLIIAMILMIFLRKHSIKSIIIMLLFILVGLGLMRTNMINAIIFKITGIDAETTSDIVRSMAREKFMGEVFQTKLNTILGCGYVNTKDMNAFIQSGIEQGLNYNDVGIIGLIFYYGFLYPVWMVFIYVKAIIEGLNNQKFVIYFLLFGLLGIYTLLPGSYVTDISFALALVMTEKKYKYMEQ